MAFPSWATFNSLSPRCCPGCPEETEHKEVPLAIQILSLLKPWIIGGSPPCHKCFWHHTQGSSHSEKEESGKRILASIDFDGLLSGGSSAHRLGTPHTLCLCSSWTALKDAFFISRRRNSSVSNWTSGPTRTSWTRGRWHVSVTGLWWADQTVY